MAKKRYSTNLKEETIDIIMDGLHMKKTEGDFYSVQGDIIEEALEDYKVKHNVVARPEDVRNKEKRGRPSNS